MLKAGVGVGAVMKNKRCCQPESLNDTGLRQIILAKSGNNMQSLNGLYKIKSKTILVVLKQVCYTRSNLRQVWMS